MSAEVKIEISLCIKCCQTMWAGHEREWELKFISFPSFFDVSASSCSSCPVFFTLHDFFFDKGFSVFVIFCLIFLGGTVNFVVFHVSHYYVLQMVFRVSNFLPAFFELCIRRSLGIHRLSSSSHDSSRVEKTSLYYL